jgi:Protein of unknown function (DUF3551)
MGVEIVMQQAATRQWHRGAAGSVDIDPIAGSNPVVAPMRLMRLLFFVSGILAGATGIGSRAEAQNYPWCGIYSKGGGGMNCGFVTFEQCMADVSGIGGFCMQNNQYVPAATPSRRRNR